MSPSAANSNNDSRLRQCSKSLNEALRKFFYRLGYRVALNPWKTVGCAFMLMFICMAGMTNFVSESRQEKLWIPQGTLALTHEDIIASTWTSESAGGPSTETRREYLIVAPASSDIQLETRSCLLSLIDLLEISSATTSVLIENTDGNDKISNLTYADVCATSTNGNVTHCSITSVLDLFYDPTLLDTTNSTTFLSNIRQSISKLTDEEILSRLFPESGTYSSWTGRPMLQRDIMSVGDEGQLRAYKVKLELELNEEVVKGRAVDVRAESWETQWIINLNGVTIPSISPTLKWFVQAVVSFRQAARESLTGDLSKIITGYNLLAVYVCFALGELSWVRSRGWLAGLALLGIGLAIGATYGIGSALGYAFGPVHQLLPLLLLGIGIDDAFVIVTAYDATSSDSNSKSSIPEKVAMALSHAGAAVTVTSTTNACAFFIGSFTVLPALESFAIWAAIGILFDFVFQTTFFVACLTWDARRQEANRLACCPCFISKTDPSTKKNGCGAEPGILSRFFATKFAPFIFNTKIRLLTAIVVLGGFGTCIVGVTELKQAFRREYFFIDGTYSKEFDEINSQFFPSNNLFVQIYTGNEVDYSSEDSQNRMTTLFTQELPADPFVLRETLDCWYLAFRNFCNITTSTIPPPLFYPKLQEFLKHNSGQKYQRSILFENPTEIRSTKSSVLLKPLADNDEEVAAMLSLRVSVDRAKVSSAFPFSFAFPFFEQYAVIRSEAIQNVVASLVVVLVVSVILIGNPFVAVIVLMGVGLSVVDILGIMHFWDINLNSVSVVNLALAVGLSIDFSAHIGLAFMEAPGVDRVKRATMALTELGPPLVHGGMSTFLAISILVFARSYVFRIFFKMFFLIIALGMFHGMVFVPQILSLVGPVGYYRTEEERVAEEEAIEASIVSSKKSVAEEK